MNARLQERRAELLRPEQAIRFCKVQCFSAGACQEHPVRASQFATSKYGFYMSESVQDGSASLQAAADFTFAHRNENKSLQRFYRPELDGLRFLAFFLVLFGHYTEYPGTSFSSRILVSLHVIGWVGVDIFLVLSSYLIFSLLLNEHDKYKNISIRKFYIRRALRIWPLYFAYIIILFSTLHYLIPKSDLHEFKTQQYVPMLIFMGNFSAILFPRQAHYGVAHLWTISLEEQFYLVAPIAVFFLARVSSRVLFCGIAVLLGFTIIVRWYIAANGLPTVASWMLPISRLDPFLAGAVIAIVYRRHPKFLNQLNGLWYALGAALLFALVHWYDRAGMQPHAIIMLVTDGIAVGMLLAAVLSPGPLRKLFGMQPFRFFGKVSFGLYVYHEIFLNNASGLFPAIQRLPSGPVAWLMGLIGVFVPTLIVSIVSYYGYERWFLLLKKRFEAVETRSA